MPRCDRSTDAAARERLERLASRALAAVAARAGAQRPQTADAGAALDEGSMRRLERAAASEDRRARLAALDEIQAAGIGAEALVDLYIPELARRLGEDWFADRRSFAEVTIGCARLQSMLHDAAVDWAEDGRRSPSAPAVLLVVLSDEYHTLGALVAATQFRRAGAETRLLLGATEGEILAEALYSDLDLVAFSVSPGVNLEVLQRIVAKLRGSRARPPLVAVGGSILFARPDVAELVGADIGCNDPREALALCELRKSQGGRTKAAGRKRALKATSS